MKVFGDDYGKYYNLIYQDKAYDSECTYVDKLIKKYSPHAESILDLGCGTGSHDILLVERGFLLTGVDSSKEMLSSAMNNKKVMGYDDKKLKFHLGDIRCIRLEKTFDVVISLFDVLSYQTTNADLLNTFQTASIHLNKGGIFIFDCWYGPGVLNDLPTVRVKEIENEQLILTRIAEPKMHLDENIVDVSYHLFVRDKKTRHVEEFRETHIMRYLFKPEIEMISENTGIDIIAFHDFMSDSLPKPGNWDVCFLGKKRF